MGRSDGTSAWSTSCSAIKRVGLQPRCTYTYTYSLRVCRAAGVTSGGNIYASGRTKAIYRFRRS